MILSHPSFCTCISPAINVHLFIHSFLDFFSGSGYLMLFSSIFAFTERHVLRSPPTKPRPPYLPQCVNTLPTSNLNPHSLLILVQLFIARSESLSKILYFRLSDFLWFKWICDKVSKALFRSTNPLSSSSLQINFHRVSDGVH